MPGELVLEEKVTNLMGLHGFDCSWLGFESRAGTLVPLIGGSGEGGGRVTIWEGYPRLFAEHAPPLGSLGFHQRGPVHFQFDRSGKSSGCYGSVPRQAAQ